MALNTYLEGRMATALHDADLAKNLCDQVNVNAADLGVAGTVTASLGTVADANKDLVGFRNLGFTGSLTASSGGDLVFSGTTGQNEIQLTDNLADALSVKIAAGADFLVFDSTNSSEKLTILSATTQKLGFYGVTPTIQGSALTTQLTTLTFTSPGTPDYAIADLTITTPYGFVSQDEGRTVLSVVSNLQARLAQVETVLENLGLVAAN